MQRQVILSSYKDIPFFIFPESVGWYDDFPGHRVDRPEGQWVTYSIHFVVKGKGYLEFDQNKYTLGKGDAFIYFPGQKQCYYSSAEEPWEVRWVHFYGDHLKSFLYDQGIKQPLWTSPRIKEWEDLFHELLLEMESYNSLSQPRISALTYAILAEFLHYAKPFSMGQSTSTQERILVLLPELQKKACSPFLLEEWASQAQLSVYYFCKLFRKATGMTPMQFVTICRMQCAKQWLIDQPHKYVKDIASEAGYPSTSYFIQQFRLQEGLTPSEYRRRKKM